jgi:hypothetical protein
LSLAGLVHVANHLAHRGSKNPGELESASEVGYLESRGLVLRLPEWQCALDKLGLEQTVQ